MWCEVIFILSQQKTHGNDIELSTLNCLSARLLSLAIDILDGLFGAVDERMHGDLLTHGTLHPQVGFQAPLTVDASHLISHVLAFEIAFQLEVDDVADGVGGKVERVDDGMGVDG